MGLSSVVEFAGVTKEVSSIHHRSDALLFPSAHEGLGNSLIEAMACGTPTIASDIPVLREVGGPTIAYASPGEATVWARAMEAMMEQPVEARDRTAREARSRVVDRYSPEANIERVVRSLPGASGQAFVELASPPSGHSNGGQVGTHDESLD